MTYRILLTHMAKMSYLAVSDSEIAQVDAAIETLAIAPDIGRVYDPLYPAARPPLEARVIYAGRYGIYYSVDHKAQTVHVHYLEDQRMNPEKRFEGRLGKKGTEK